MERRRPSILARTAAASLVAVALSACAPATREPQVASLPPPEPAPAPSPQMQTFEATAYSIEGETASGKQAREGICAADPDVLPLGTRVRLHGADQFSGECLIADTGRAINGREIDIYVASDRAAKKFGRQQVGVEVLSRAE